MLRPPRLSDSNPYDMLILLAGLLALIAAFLLLTLALL